VLETASLPHQYFHDPAGGLPIPHGRYYRFVLSFQLHADRVTNVIPASASQNICPRRQSYGSLRILPNRDTGNTKTSGLLAFHLSP
jgi:hypothetical protein